MPTAHSFSSFESELNRLTAIFEKNISHYKKAGYDEASLRQEFLNPLFSALGWDVENKAGHIPQKREVEVESRTQIGGRAKRADYLFRTDGRDRFVCEAKKPTVDLDAKEAFQAKRYAWNKDLPLALLTDFEEMKVYVVGGKPHIDEPQVGEWKTWHYKQYPLIAQELWDLLSREKVAGGAIDTALDALPKKKPTGTGKAKQQWLIKPDRSRALDHDFLELLDGARRDLASDLYKLNDHDALFEDNLINEAVQCIIDRILFLRICEDRDIDTGGTLQSIVETWRRNYGHDEGRKFRQESLRMKEDATGYLDDASGGGGGTSSAKIAAPRESLWFAIIRHFRALDRRPASHVPYFNGNIFKLHGSERLLVSDEWLAGFIGELSDDETPYLFNVIPVEILGSVYERFLGKVVVRKGRGTSVDDKPEVRKAGGVYYTPRYIVDYIVEQTVGRIVEGVAPEKSLALRLLDPACGSGSFLIRAFERMCEHWQEWLTKNVDKRKKKWCWVDKDTGDVHLTVDLKRRILTENIYGVDLDGAAVEVTQLSLYLKMLEGETRSTLQRERELFAEETALLPALQGNIKWGNSLIASDFLDGELLTDDAIEKMKSVHAFDWEVGFRDIMKAGGFDAVIGNPPYIQLSMEEFRDDQVNSYLKKTFEMSGGRLNTFTLFLEKARGLCKERGRLGQIVPNTLLTQEYYEESRARLVANTHLAVLAHPKGQVFDDAVVENIIVVARRLSRSEKLEAFATEFGDLTETGLENNQSVPQAAFAKNYKTSFVAPADPEISALREKLNGNALNFDDCLNINQAIALKHDRAACLTQQKVTAKHHEILDGRHIGRYFTGDSPNYFKFDVAKIHSCKREDIFMLPEKIFMRRVGDSLIGTLDREQKFALNTLVVLTPNDSCLFGIRFILGLFNSKLLNFFYTRFLKSTKKVFSEIQARQVGQLPIPYLDLNNKADRARHDKLVTLVDKMLALTPKLRAAKDSEKATLQNAVSKTDGDIDALVYELYGLTPEEIALVEGGR